MKQRKQKKEQPAEKLRSSEKKKQHQERWLDVKEGDLEYDSQDPHGLRSSVKQKQRS